MAYTVTVARHCTSDVVWDRQS